MVSAVAEHFLGLQSELGECPVWDWRTGTLYLVDILRCRLIGYDWSAGTMREWPLPALGGGLALAAGGGLVVATQRGIYRFDPATGAYSFLTDPEPEARFNRLNEGKVDRAGRFWIGSICTIDRRPSGALYRVRPDGSHMRMLDGISVPNSLAWSPDGGTLYFADSHLKQIWRFGFDPAEGTLHDRQLFADCRERPGMPDGVAVDATGSLWSAAFGAGTIRRFAPDGRVTGEWSLPATQVTSCAFAGPDLDHLVIVTTKRLLDDQGRRQQPLAGDLFVLRPGVRGLAEPEFGG